MIKDINYLEISDVHLFHRKNKTIEIIKNLDIYFDNYSISSKFSKLDIIFIAGDLFDDLKQFDDVEIDEVLLWLDRLMGFCIRFNIKLRILEGTPSHDWKQSRKAVTLSKVKDGLIDFKYIDTLHIEYMKDLDIHILYIPDEWTASAITTFKQVQDLMKSMNINKVDIGIFHGAFTYQMGGLGSKTVQHNEFDYLNIVKYFINIGHIHEFSVYQRILASGSFDRLNHGSEFPKGGILCSIKLNGENTFQFIENKFAKIFKTIILKNKDLDKSLAKINKELKDIPIDSHIRIKSSKDHPIYIAFEELKIKYPMLYWTKISIEDEEELETSSKNNDEQLNDYVSISITPDNIKTLLTAEILKKNSLSIRQSQLLNEILT